MATTLSLFAGAGAQFFDNNGLPLNGGKIYTYLAGSTTPQPTYTTVSGTSNHANPIELDSAGRVAGSGEIWLPVGVAYKFVLTTATDTNPPTAPIATYDNIPSAPQPPIVNDASSINYEQGYLVNAGSFIVGKTYQIETTGTTDFNAIGASANTVGLIFTATGVGSGTGTATFSRTVQNKLQEIVSVKDFGAVGNGVADDTVAIQAAVNYAISISSPSSAISILGFGVAVYFPAGSYVVTSPITVNNHGIGFIGDVGKGSEIKGNVNLFDIGDYTNTRRVRCVAFQNLNLVCSNTAGTAAAIKLYRTTQTKFNQVNFIAWNIGIDCYRASQTQITTCFASNATRTAQAVAWIRMQGTDESVSTGENYTPGGGMHINDCEIVGKSSAGSFDTNAGILIYSVDGFYLSQTHFTGCISSLDIAPTATAENYVIIDVLVVNCYFDEPSDFSTTWNATVRGTVKETITAASGATRTSVYQGLRFVNNLFRGATAVNKVTRNFIIQVTDGDSWFDSTRRLRDILFSNCSFRQAKAANFQAYGGSANYVEPYDVVIDGNFFELGNSDANGNLGAAIAANMENCVISNNVFGETAGNSDYIVNVVALDNGTADNPNPSAVVVGNDLAKANVVDVSSGNPEPVRINVGGSANSNTLQSDNLYAGAGREINQQYKLSTTNATTTDIFTFTIPSALAGNVTASVSGSNADGTKAVAYEFYVGFRNNGTTSSLSTGTSSWTSVRAWNPDSIATPPTADLTTNQLRVRVTGVVSETWTWVCKINLNASK